MEKKVLIIDDNEELQSRLSEYLTEFNFSVRSLLTGVNIIRELKNQMPDIIILDIMLPDKDGLEVLKDIRTEFSVPVLMLTAKGEDMDRILGLELGADDYLPKPFNPRELLARLKAILRRFVEEGKNPVSGKLSINSKKSTLVYDNNEIELSYTEIRIMDVFLKNTDMILSREKIMQLAHSKDYLAFDRSIDIQISRLRTKLKQLTGSDKWIKTYHGTGYMLAGEL